MTSVSTTIGSRGPYRTGIRRREQIIDAATAVSPSTTTPAALFAPSPTALAPRRPRCSSTSVAKKDC